MGNSSPGTTTGGGSTDTGSNQGKSDGSTIYLNSTLVDTSGEDDSTDKLEEVLNSRDNVRYILQDSEKIKITRPIKMTKNGIHLDLCVNGTISVGDNCGINDYIYSSEFSQIPGLINVFGDNCKITGGIIDRNVWNNKMLSVWECRYNWRPNPYR